jgi:hypothetical protein
MAPVEVQQYDGNLSNIVPASFLKGGVSTQLLTNISRNDSGTGRLGDDIWIKSIECNLDFAQKDCTYLTVTDPLAWNDQVTRRIQWFILDKFNGLTVPTASTIYIDPANPLTSFYNPLMSKDIKILKRGMLTFDNSTNLQQQIRKVKITFKKPIRQVYTDGSTTGAIGVIQKHAFYLMLLYCDDQQGTETTGDLTDDAAIYLNGKVRVRYLA